jgi:hypothetical protein
MEVMQKRNILITQTSTKVYTYSSLVTVSSSINSELDNR